MLGRLLDRRSLQFIAYFLQAYPSRTALMIGLLVVAGLAEGVGLATLLPLVELASEGGGAEGSALTRTVVGHLARLGLPATLPVLLGLIVVAIAVKGLFLWLAMKQVGYTIAQIATDLRLRLIRALTEAQWAHFISQPAGFFANAISTEAHRASAAYREACSLLAGIIQSLIYLTVIVLLSWRAALLMLVFGIVVATALRRFVRMARAAGNQQTSLMKSLVARLTQLIPGLKPIKAMAREQHILPLLEREAQGFHRAQERMILAIEAVHSFREPIIVGVIAAGLYVVVTFMDVGFSAVLVLAVVFYRTMTTFGNLQSQYQRMTVGESALWSLRETVEGVENARELSFGRTPPQTLEFGMRFENLSFRYSEHTDWILRDVTIVFPARQLTVLTGPSGAGKTTIVDLLIGLLRPSRGTVYVDKTALSELDVRLWRRQIGYVPQEVLLFHDSILENVTLGDPSISKKEVRDALERAGAWDFVSRLPRGLDQPAGERGTKLSGGQRQRISIARALVHKPTLLILDEPTTALDPETERAICSTLKRLTSGLSIVAISHQEAFRSIADVVYMISEGTAIRLEPQATKASPLL